MASMTDGNQIASMFNWMLNGASIGTQPTMPPYLLLMSAQNAGTKNKGGNNGTEMTNTNLPGYTGGGGHAGNGGGKQLAASGAGFGTFSNATFAAVTNTNAASWSISGTQTANVVAVEVWDNAVSAVRLLQGTITAISGAVSGDTIQFASASISADPTQW